MIEQNKKNLRDQLIKKRRLIENRTEKDISVFQKLIENEKVKNAGSRIHASERFAAVIFGNCPHKVAGMRNYSNIIDEFKSRANCPIAVDARNEAGGLKITKQSFKKALADICRQLKIQEVA